MTVVLTAGGEKDGSRSISAADYANAVGSRFKMVSAAEAVEPARFVGGGAAQQPQMCCREGSARGNMLFPYSGIGNSVSEGRSVNVRFMYSCTVNKCCAPVRGCVSEMQSPGEETRKDSPGKATGSCTSVRRRERRPGMRFSGHGKNVRQNIQPAVGSKP